MPQQAHDVETTSYQSRSDAMMPYRRRIDVDTALFRRHMRRNYESLATVSRLFYDPLTMSVASCRKQSQSSEIEASGVSILQLIYAACHPHSRLNKGPVLLSKTFKLIQLSCAYCFTVGRHTHLGVFILQLIYAANRPHSRPNKGPVILLKNGCK